MGSFHPPLIFHVAVCLSIMPGAGHWTEAGWARMVARSTAVLSGALLWTETQGNWAPPLSGLCSAWTLHIFQYLCIARESELLRSASWYRPPTCTMQIKMWRISAVSNKRILWTWKQKDAKKVWKSFLILVAHLVFINNFPRHSSSPQKRAMTIY